MQIKTRIRIVLLLGGAFLISLGLYMGVSFGSLGTTMYTMGIWWASTGLFIGIHNKYLALLLGIGVALGLGYYYNSPELLIHFGVGIFGGAFSALLDARNAKKIRPAPPKPPWMAITLVGILALGMMTPLGGIHLTTAASAKFEINIADNGEIRCQPGDNSSYYDVLIQDKNSLVQYTLTVFNDSATVIINGREFTIHFEKPACPNIESSTPDVASISNASTHFWWDRIWFINKTLTTVKYPHADRDYYGISLWSSWTATGRKLLHNQVDQETSKTVAGGGPEVIATLIGALIGSRVHPVYGTLIGTLVGVIVGIALKWYAGTVWLDESSCLWWWIGKAFFRWLYDAAVLLVDLYSRDPVLAIVPVMAAFMTMGYLRVGSFTFGDFTACGSPGDPETPDYAQVMWYGNFYLTKPGTRICYYRASEDREWIEDKIGPAAVRER